MVPAYGSIRSGKRQREMESPVRGKLFLKLGLTQFQQVPQVFYKCCNGHLGLIVANIVDDITIAGLANNAKAFVDHFNTSFSFWTVVCGLGRVRSFGINTV